ncbi:MAG: divalent cation tolerance protein CutA [Pseudonocardia sp.]|nr:divalent cation tolerance protein CutA [Pseudonocardia sp.]
MKARIKELHPCDIPEIAALPVTDRHPDYFAWIDAEPERELPRPR